MKKSYLIISIIILTSLATGFYFYPQVPDKMASHWNAKGEVDGYMSKFWGVFLMPIIILAMFLLFLLVPKIDPLKANIEKFRKYFDIFIIFISLFLLYIYLLTLFWNKGMRFDMGQVMMPAVGLLIFYCGVLISKAKRNWFIGIRTPWTLSNDTVWEKTHRLGGKLFKISGIVILLGILLKNLMIWFVLIPVIVSSIYLVVYSYFEFQREQKRR